MSDQQETITPKDEEIKKEYEIKIKDNRLRIEINNDKIIFILIIGISNYKYIKQYEYEEIIKELEILDFKDIEEIYKYLLKCEYEIKKEEKIIIINKSKEIKLDRKLLKNEEIIKILIKEINEIKDNTNEKIKELITMNEEKKKKINILENKFNILKKEVIKFLKNKKDKNRDEINLIYVTDKEDNYNIFGKKFVEKNKDNIELDINGENSKLINEYKLRKGENNIKMKIKYKITDLQSMFYECKNLKNIDELKYLNTKYCNNFEDMFWGCSSLSNIKGLEKWNVSNGKDFAGMFYGCSSLSDIKGLENWNVSNGNNFEAMFWGCSSLSDIKGLENWNVSNGNNFGYMFCGCSSLSDFKILEKWNVSKSLLKYIK